METEFSFGLWSLLPLALALVTAFRTRSAIFALFVGCIVGVFMTGFAAAGGAFNPVYGLSDLIQTSLGGGEFVWISLIIVFIGILFELFKISGVISAFAESVSKKCETPRQVKTTSWLMGFLIVDDYFSPLMTGPIMRPLSDKAVIPREKLAFILDSTTASVCVLVPFMSWGAYLAGLIAKEGGPVVDMEMAISVFANAIPYNVYPILLLIFSLLICLEKIPDFGPMKAAEKRAREEGKLLRDGAVPMVSEEGDELFETSNGRASLLLDLIIPVAIIFGTVFVSYFVFDNMKIAEAFMTAVFYLAISLYWRGIVSSVNELTNIALLGVKSVMPAIVLMALAYCINTLTKDLGAAQYIMAASQGYMTPALFVAVTFFITAVISFSTGTSWGAYALMIPFALPIAYGFTSGVAADPLVYKAIAAVVGGGIFGDHASPVSDTSVLSSIGAGSDHMDHVITQLPYALTVGVSTIIIYLFI
jgi:Na+/H+ antiporter NhaC